MIKKPIFYDTDVLSCFISIEDTSILEELFGKIFIFWEVYKEFQRSRKQFLIMQIEDLINRKFVFICDIDLESEDYEFYTSIIHPYIIDKEIGKGEAATITLAKKYNGTVASNNTKVVKFLVEKYNLQYITTEDILAMAYEKNMISEEEGNMIWAKMLKRGRWLNSKNFSSYLMNTKK